MQIATGDILSFLHRGRQRRLQVGVHRFLAGTLQHRNDGRFSLAAASNFRAEREWM